MENRTDYVLEIIEEHPIIKQIAAKKTVEILLEHKRAADAITALKTELASFPDPEEAVREKQAELDRLESSAAILRSEITKITAETRVARMKIEGRIKLLEGDLMDGSDATVDAGLEFSSDPQQSGKNMLVRTKWTSTAGSNADALNRAIVYCMNCINELKRIKPSSEFNVEKIKARKGGILPFDQLSEVSGTEANSRTRKPSRARSRDDFLDLWGKKISKKVSQWRRRLRL